MSTSPTAHSRSESDILRIGELVFGTLFQKLPIGIALFDREYRLQAFNPVWASFVEHYTPSSASEVIIGKRLFELAPDSEPYIKPSFERVFKGETIRNESFRTVSGGYEGIWDVVLAPVIKDGRVIGVLDVVSDVTGRIHADRRLELVMQTANDGVWDWDLRSNEVFYSPRWKSILGFKEDELPDTYDAWHSLLHPDDLARSKQRIKEFLSGESEVYELEHRLRRKDGTYAWILSRGVLVRNEEGAPQRLVGVHTDISSLRQAQETLRAQSEFETLVMSISTQFINLPPDAVDEGIQAALKRLGEFAQVERSYVFLFSDDHSTLSNTHEWCADGVEAQLKRLQNLPVDLLPWSNTRLLCGKVVHVPDLNDLPPEAEAERVLLSSQGVRSFIAVPMSFQKRVVGFLGFDAVGCCKAWNEHSINLLTIIGEIFVNALERRRSHLALQAYQRGLEERVEQRTIELERRRQVAASLSDTLRALNSDIPLQEVLEYICKQACQLLEASAAMIRHADQEHKIVRTIASADLPPDLDVIAETPLYMGESDHMLFNQQPVVDGDLTQSMQRALDDPQQAVQLDDLVKAGFRATLKHFGSQIKVPLFTREGIFGSLTLLFKGARNFSPEDIALAMSYGDQASLAIENARLYQQEQERRIEAEKRRQVAEGLREMLTVLNSQRPLDVVLESIVGLAETLLSAQAVAIFRLRPDEPLLEIHSARGLSAEYIRMVNVPVGKGAAGRAVESGKPVIIEDAAAFLQEVALDYDGEVRQRVLHEASGRFKSLLAVPMTVGDTPFGAISLYYNHHRQFQKEEVDLAVSFADQAALAIETARLREQAGLVAAAAERNRLARDLHDAVTQTLFSASLIAEVLPRLLESKPDEAAVRLEELRQLTRGALAEMRTLLLELRPSSLTEVSLGDLLRQLCEAFTGRARVPVRLNVEGEVHLPPEVQVALYRIAQEALNNIAKHAGAKQVSLQLRSVPAEVDLRIEDDGSGFDLDEVGAGHFGLKIMAERAEAAGAAFSVQSAPGKGTKIKVSWRQVEGEGMRHE